jgi:hypothetical protein
MVSPTGMSGVVKGPAVVQWPREAVKAGRRFGCEFTDFEADVEAGTLRAVSYAAPVKSLEPVFKGLDLRYCVSYAAVLRATDEPVYIDSEDE